ncbi:MAG: glycosyltransferase family 39 protein [Paucibacter sp.]|nr:glycosyltransferase family 39 protein [Roseateles sp.]
MLPDEGRYVGVAWEMMRSHDWLTPTLDGLPYFHKPPLFYWITAASMSLFGTNEWAARAAPLLGATLGAMALWLLIRRHGGGDAEARVRNAELTLVALLAQPLFFLGGQFANLDTLVAGCITATVALLADAVFSMESGKPYRRALLGAYAMGALGVLAKGLIGFVIPGGIVVVWLLLMGRWRTFLRLLSPVGLLVFLAIAAPWFLAMQQRFPDFLHYFFVVQHFQRFAAGGFNNVQPFWFYPGVLLIASLPWWPWLRRLFARGYLADPIARPLRLLMLCWFAVPVLFFSLPQSKLLGYVLPAVPPLAWLVADAWRIGGKSSVRGWRAAAAGSLLFCLVIVSWLAVKPPHSERDLGRALAEHYRPGDSIVMLDQYYFDFPIYARLQAPNVIVDDWRDGAILSKDSWRKEVFDAGRFAPDLASELLLTTEQLPARLCRESRVWVLGTDEAFKRRQVPGVALPVATELGVTLWQLDQQAAVAAGQLSCSA